MGRSLLLLSYPATRAGNTKAFHFFLRKEVMDLSVRLDDSVLRLVSFGLIRLVFATVEIRVGCFQEGIPSREEL